MSTDKKRGLFQDLTVSHIPEPFGWFPRPKWYDRPYCTAPMGIAEMARGELLRRFRRSLVRIAEEGVRVLDVSHLGWRDDNLSLGVRQNERVHRVYLSEKAQELLFEHEKRAAEIALQAIEAYIAHVAAGGDPNADFTPVFHTEADYGAGGTDSETE